jgi:hypothetical protein
MGEFSAGRAGKGAPEDALNPAAGGRADLVCSWLDSGANPGADPETDTYPAGNGPAGGKDCVLHSPREARPTLTQTGLLPRMTYG